MKRIFKFLATSLVWMMLVVQSCGIPKDKQEAMQASLLNELAVSFINDSVVLPSQISVELKDVQKNDEQEAGVYKAHFNFSFHDFWDKSEYNTLGTAYFDSDGNIVRESGKKNIRINVISKNHKVVSSDEMVRLRPKDILGW